ncbi:MAG TPA: hypothetical protein VFJ14_16425 [Nocardioidaceae bacterium]|nr:hypothetical protein [Nocardioidaceae bacterium]
MSEAQANEESEAVSLLSGLAAILGLLFISIIGIGGPAWLGLLVGAVDLVVAWRVTPPPRARSLRAVAGLMGVLTVAWSLVRLFVF